MIEVKLVLVEARHRLGVTRWRDGRWTCRGRVDKTILHDERLGQRGRKRSAGMVRWGGWLEKGQTSANGDKMRRKTDENQK